MTTDKPIYQPGQTVRIRSLILSRGNGKPAANQPVQFTFTNPQAFVIFQSKQTSSRFGIASLDCPLAAELAEGDYLLRCTSGDTHSELPIKVEKYILPKIKLSAQWDKTYYRPGDVATLKVQANHFFGRPVSGGKVTISPLESPQGLLPKVRELS